MTHSAHPAPGDQPPPIPNDRPSVQSMVRADLEERERVGVQRYGTPLQAHNGRDALVDAYQEALDLACYLRQAIAERDDDPRHIIEFRTDAWTIKHPLSCRIGDLFGCRVNLAAEDLGRPPYLGRYEVTVDSIDGRLRVGDRVDQEATAPEADPADAEADQVAVQQMLDDATRAFAAAGTSSERVEVIRDLLAGWYAAWPASAVTDEHEGIAHQIVALVYAAEARASTTPSGHCPCTCHQPGRCPCQPGTPNHRHGAGGYCTVGDAAQHHHTITFASDATWTMTHPASCAVAAGAPSPDTLHDDCTVRQLADRQIPSDLATLMAGGRYTCSAGDLGDLFQLGDRLHDDQCTSPVCAACVCWCHAEEQTEG